MKIRYRVEGLTFVTEKEAIQEASKITKYRNFDREYVLISLELDVGWYLPHLRVYKNGRLENEKSRSGEDRQHEKTNNEEILT